MGKIYRKVLTLVNFLCCPQSRGGHPLATVTMLLSKSRNIRKKWRCNILRSIFLCNSTKFSGSTYLLPQLWSQETRRSWAFRICCISSMLMIKFQTCFFNANSPPVAVVNTARSRLHVSACPQWIPGSTEPAILSPQDLWKSWKVGSHLPLLGLINALPS